MSIADDGGGMDPQGIRKCMSLGYSSKKTNTTIGQCNYSKIPLLVKIKSCLPLLSLILPMLLFSILVFCFIFAFL